MSGITAAVDVGGIFGRGLTDLERTQLPFAIMQTVNRVAWIARQEWEKKADQVFDRPTAMTRRAVQYQKATKRRLYAEVKLRDEAFKGTPPSRYLSPQVQGGMRNVKRFERLLQHAGIMPAGSFAMPGSGFPLDGYGNMRGGVITRMLSQLRAQNDPLQNTPKPKRQVASGTRRKYEKKTTHERAGLKVPKRTPRKKQQFFAIKQKHGKLLAGVYERIQFGHGSAVRPYIIFARQPAYTQRYNIFDYAGEVFDREMPTIALEELSKAVASAFKGGA